MDILFLIIKNIKYKRVRKKKNLGRKVKAVKKSDEDVVEKRLRKVPALAGGGGRSHTSPRDVRQVYLPTAGDHKRTLLSP